MTIGSKEERGSAIQYIARERWYVFFADYSSLCYSLGTAVMMVKSFLWNQLEWDDIQISDAIITGRGGPIQIWWCLPLALRG